VLSTTKETFTYEKRYLHSSNKLNSANYSDFGKGDKERMRYSQISSSLNPSIIFGRREHIFILNISHKVRGPYSFIEWEITISSDCSQGKGERLRCI
jgi:hypothetical protein